MEKFDVKQALMEYHPKDDREALAVREILRFLNDNPDSAFDRTNAFGHITGSALVVKSIILVVKRWKTGGHQGVPFKLKLCYAITGTEVTGKMIQVAKSLRVAMIGFQTERKLLPQRVTFYPVPVTQVAISSTRVAVLGKKMRYYFSPRSATIKVPRGNQSRNNHEAREHHRYNLWSARRRLS